MSTLCRARFPYDGSQFAPYQVWRAGNEQAKGRLRNKLSTMNKIAETLETGGELSSLTEDNSFPVEKGKTASPTHVLFLIDQLCEMGGAERILMNTIRLLPADRFRCSLITFKIDPSLPVFADFPCPYQVFPIRRTYGFDGMKVAWKIREFMQRENVAIVHSFFETSDIWGGLIAKSTGRALLISSRRDMGILRSKKHDLAYRLMHPCFDLVTTVSEEVRRFCIQKDKLAPAKVQTLYNGLDLAKVDLAPTSNSLRPSLGIGPEVPLITTVGHIRKVKGIDIFIEAAAQVRNEFPNAVFLVVGRNSEPKHADELKLLIEKHRLEQNFRFLGETEAIYPLLKASDVFVLPSRSEGFSNALIEAMACGLPCVATRVGGNAEAIEEGVNGYLVENEDINGLADRLLRLLHDPVSAKAMGAAGRNIVKAKFTSEVMIDQLVGHYQRLLESRQN